jgi:hypothetical protein
VDVGMTKIITAGELARILEMPETAIHDLACVVRLPMACSAIGGLYIHAADLPAWKPAARIYHGEEGVPDEPATP